MLNKLIFVQWTNGFGGLEKITQLYEEKFKHLNPLVAILRHEENGLEYKNRYRFKNSDKFFFIFEYIRFIWQNKTAIYHIQYAGSFIPLFTYLAGARKIVFHFHGTMFPHRFIHKLVWKYLQNKISIISNTLHTQRTIKEKLYVNQQIHNIPNFIDLTKFEYSKRSYKGEKFVVTYAGRFAQGKNTDIIIETAKIIKTLHDNIEFVLVGDGTDRDKLQSLINEYSLSSSVKLLPFTDDIVSVYRKSHMFLFLSSFESFGNVVAEAILTGLPVLCFKIPALKELINEDSFFIENLDPNEIAGKIVEFKNTYADVNDKLVKVHKKLNGYLDNETNIEKLNSIYKNLGVK